VCAQAALLSEQHGLTVALIDDQMDRRWPNNYGVWLEEWQGKQARARTQGAL
jgi:hypothetical protein